MSKSEKEIKPKLVRDRIPEIIRRNGKTPITRRLDDKEYKEALGDKIAEEAHELAGAKTAAEILEERADLQEALNAFDRAHDLSPEQIEAARLAKGRLRGGFAGRILLEGIEE